MSKHATTDQPRAATELRRRVRALTLAAATGAISACAAGTDAATVDTSRAPGAAGAPYPNMPAVAPIGERIGKYFDVPASALGPAIPAGKAYRLQD
ncbi:MAG TPA: hypothetical protein VG106_11320, partial [Vicinamibacterales bacterium]|nr:hypothetical protein [Vicinamibacterales bacterium]